MLYGRSAEDIRLSKTPETSFIRSKDYDQRYGYEEERKEGTDKDPEGKKSREEAQEGRKKALYALVVQSEFDY